MADYSISNVLARMLMEGGAPALRNPLLELGDRHDAAWPTLPTMADTRPSLRPYDPQANRPMDWAERSGVGENAGLAPLRSGAGLGELLGRGRQAIADRDWSTAADLAPMALGIFAGMKAKTANLPMLERAQGMAAKGADRGAIWNDTGWFQGRDGKWRWEINDRNAAVPAKTGMGPAIEMLPHPEFSAAYPHLDKLHTVIDTTDSALGGNFGHHPVYGDTIVIGVPDLTLGRRLGLHERQHATQKEEGFQRGANPQSFKSDPETIRKIITGQLDDMLPEKSNFADYLTTAAHLEVPGFKGTTLGELKQHILAQQLLGRLPADMSGIANKLSDTIAHNRYRRTAGEVEARNVERRSRMSDEQRRAKPPWETQDILDEWQILR